MSTYAAILVLLDMLFITLLQGSVPTEVRQKRLDPASGLGSTCRVKEGLAPVREPGGV